MKSQTPKGFAALPDGTVILAGPDNHSGYIVIVQDHHQKAKGGRRRGERLRFLARGTMFDFLLRLRYSQGSIVDVEYR